ncbi:hypothetical protein GR927_46500 [Mycolicibacterium sp. 3033]|nr:hypothetical protein [Mycolicibacterium aurantiacum]
MERILHGRWARLIVLVGLTTLGAAAAAVIMSAGVLDDRKPADARPTTEQVAEDRCATDVLDRLVSPSTARLSDVRTERSRLDSEGKDLFSLTLEKPLQGVDHTRITVLNVSGVVNAPSEVGSTLQDHFDCRAYFVDGELVHALVLMAHEH